MYCTLKRRRSAAGALLASCCEGSASERRSMITVTEQAKEFFLGAEYPEGTVLRLDPLEVDQATGRVEIGLLAGKPKAGDQVVEHEGEGLLHIAEPVSEALDGGTIDTVETPEGPKIDILPPPPEDMLGPKPSVNGSS